MALLIFRQKWTRHGVESDGLFPLGRLGWGWWWGVFFDFLVLDGCFIVGLSASGVDEVAPPQKVDMDVGDELESQNSIDAGGHKSAGGQEDQVGRGFNCCWQLGQNK